MLKKTKPKIIFQCGFLEIKTFIHLHDSNHVCFNMHKNFNRKNSSPTKSKVYSFFAISKINNTVRYILFIMFIACYAFALHYHQVEQLYHILVIPLKEIANYFNFNEIKFVYNMYTLS